MKNKIYLLLTSLFILTSCEMFNQNTSINSESTSKQENSEDSSSESSSSIESSSSKSQIESSTSESSSFLEESSPIATGPRDIDFYAINDFHGAVIENGNEVGIVRLGSFLKEKANNDNTVLINSGDMFQGSIESNYNYGELLTKCCNYIGFDSFAIGNHEFDWGASYINKNRNIFTSNHQMDFLGANIYNYDIANKEVLDYADLGAKYTIKTLENGLKVGIIGVIGTDQITSISSQFSDDYSFEDTTPIVKELSDELRIEEKCDVVVLSAHASQWQILEDERKYGVDYSGLTTISPNSNKRYVDAIFCAHSHQNEKEKINGVPLIQASSNGRMYSNVKMTVSVEGNVTTTLYGNYYSSDLSATKYNDSNLKNLVKEYTDVTDEIGSEVLVNVSDTFKSNDECINLICTAMYEIAKEQGYNVDYAICNKARANLSYGTLTYAMLYKSFPFDNEIYIVKASGRDVAKELEANYGGYRANKAALSNSKTYTVAVVDYIGFHRGSSRNYDYMPSIEVIDKLSKEGKTIYSYRDILADYLRSLTSSIDPSDYDDSLDRHNMDNLYSSIN